jgi:fructose 1,6-bisphosphate aldolase/phosphatase
MITLSIIKADVGGLVGHTTAHPDLIDKAREELEKPRNVGSLSITSSAVRAMIYN